MTAAASSEMINLKNKIEARIESLLQGTCGMSREVALSLVSFGGKRIRPLLAVMSSQLIGPAPDCVFDIAASSELIHMASLIHDDIVDDSPLRRGHPTANSILGNAKSVLIGDFLFARALEVLSSMENKTILTRMVKMMQIMCEGELQQMNESFDFDVSEEDYLARIEKKTAVFMATCCSVGALASESDEKSEAACYEFGLKFGLAFQITDDILDFSSEETRLGKPVCSDLSKGVITLPVIKALKNTKFEPELRKIIESGKTQEHFKRVIQILVDSGGVDYSKEIAKKLIRDAKNCLNLFEASPAKNCMIKFADDLLDRSF